MYCKPLSSQRPPDIKAALLIMCPVVIQLDARGHMQISFANLGLKEYTDMSCPAEQMMRNQVMERSA